MLAPFARRLPVPFRRNPPTASVLSFLRRNSNSRLCQHSLAASRPFSRKSQRWDAFGEEGVVEGSSLPHFKKKSTPAVQNSAAAVSTNSKDSSLPVYDKDTYYPPMINHIWSKEEIKQRTTSQPQHEPVTLTDKAARFLVKTVLYRGFNYLSGFDYQNPTPKACGFRLILLESVAGVPGMVAAVFRHFTSLRTLRRDHGWIHTLLEESQNERMHLLVCLKKFDAGLGTRVMVCVGQYMMVTFLSLSYLVHPKFLHRFVGYLEETAVKTYSDLIRITRTKGTKLNKAWGGDAPGTAPSPAPKLAIAYWGLSDNATWLDVLEQLLADESHHRDVNHAFADLEPDEPNPFLAEKIRDLEKAGKRGVRGA